MTRVKWYFHICSPSIGLEVWSDDCRGSIFFLIKYVCASFVWISVFMFDSVLMQSYKFLYRTDNQTCVCRRNHPVQSFSVNSGTDWTVNWNLWRFKENHSRMILRNQTDQKWTPPVEGLSVKFSHSEYTPLLFLLSWFVFKHEASEGFTDTHCPLLSNTQHAHRLWAVILLHNGG